MTQRFLRGGPDRRLDRRFYGPRIIPPTPIVYRVGNSLRFNSADSPYLSRTPGSNGTRTKFGLSMWVKRAALSTDQVLMSTYDGSNFDVVKFDTSDKLQYQTHNPSDGGTTSQLITSSVFRDLGAWIHIYIAVDTTATSRAIYVNGASMSTTTAGGTFAASATLTVNTSGAEMRIGRNTSTNASYPDAYIAEVHYIDGAPPAVSTFGQTDALTGQWVPKQVTGVTYGTNGFYLNMLGDGTASATGIGKDSSGNGNNLTPTNFSVTSGVGNDSVIDTPSNNFCVFNGLSLTTTAALTNGCLDAGASGVALGTFGLSTRKHYFEITSTGGTTTVGLHNGSATSTTTVTTGTTKGFRFDADAGTFDWTSDGSSWTSIATGLTSGPYFVYVSTAAATTATLNAGQKAFALTIPAGYGALSTDFAAHPGDASPKTGTFTGNASAAGPFVWLGYPPNTGGTCTINGNAITWGTHADALANGFKLRTTNASYNASGSNSYSIAINTSASFARNAKALANP